MLGKKEKDGTVLKKTLPVVVLIGYARYYWLYELHAMIAG
jgi:hypothetical protein